MWKKIIKKIVFLNLINLNFYTQNDLFTKKLVKKSVAHFVVEGINCLPKFYSFSLKVYCTALSFFYLFGPSSFKISFLKLIPFFGMLNKFVRAMIFLRLFDLLPLSKKD